MSFFGPAEKAYGPRDPTKVIKLGQPHPHLGPKPGIIQKARVPVGPDKEYTLIVSDGDGRLILDENSPLAGQDLVFDIELVDIVS